MNNTNSLESDAPGTCLFEIAAEVAELLRLPGARGLFLSRIEAAAEEWQKRHRNKKAQEERRRDELRATGKRLPYKNRKSMVRRVKDQLCQASELPDSKRRRTFHWLETLEDGQTWESWLPNELSPHHDSDDSLPWPVPGNRAVTLDERYAVLAAIHDHYWKGSEKLNPFANIQTDPEKSAWFRLLCLAGDPVLESRGVRTTELSREDLRIVKTWLDEVKLDSDLRALQNHHADARPARGRGRKKADYETVQKEAELAADWERARDARIYKPEFTKNKNMTVRQLDALLDRVAKRKRHSE